MVTRLRTSILDPYFLFKTKQQSYKVSAVVVSDNEMSCLAEGKIKRRNMRSVADCHEQEIGCRSVR